MKQKQKQKQKSNTDTKVKKLIELFNEIQNEYISKSVIILNNIINLRKGENPNYSIDDLESEEGLEEHKEKIKPLLRYNNVSDKVKQYQQEGKIKSSTVFLLANLGQEARKEKNQNKIIDMIVNGEIENKDLIGKEYHLLTKIGGNPMGEVEKIYLETIYCMKTISSLMEENKALLRTPKAKKLIRQYFPILQRKVKELLG